MSDKRVRKEAVARDTKKWQMCPKTAEATLKASDPGEGKVAGTLWIDFMVTTWRVGAWKIPSRRCTVVIGFWVQM